MFLWFLESYFFKVDDSNIYVSCAIPDPIESAGDLMCETDIKWIDIQSLVWLLWLFKAIVI